MLHNIKCLYLHCVFHGIRFKVNNGDWLSVMDSLFCFYTGPFLELKLNVFTGCLNIFPIATGKIVIVFLSGLLVTESGNGFGRIDGRFRRPRQTNLSRPKHPEKRGYSLSFNNL